MGGVKAVAEILKGFAVMSLPSPVQPDGDQRQQRKRLPLEENRLPQKLQFIAEAAQYFGIDIPKAEQLSIKVR